MIANILHFLAGALCGLLCGYALFWTRGKKAGMKQAAMENDEFVAGLNKNSRRQKGRT